MRSNYDVVMLVADGVPSDSRALRIARTAYASGLTVLLLGLGTEPGDGELERLPGKGPDVYLLPPPPVPTGYSGPAARVRRHRALLATYGEGVLRVCADFTPRVIHSHDLTAIAAGGGLKQFYAEAGRSVPWIHDVHEWAGGPTDFPPPVEAVSAAEEARWIGSVDVLTTISPAVGRTIRDRYDLPTEPTVVLNTPLVSDLNLTYEPTVREVVGLDDETPLVVYCGQVTEAAGVHELVSALALLPGVHAALVTSDRSVYVDHLVRLAESEGNGGRLHLIDCVDQGDLAGFIRTASIGVNTRAQYGKVDAYRSDELFEYVHAQLPVVVADCRALAAFAGEQEIGASYQVGEVASLAGVIARVVAESHRFRSGLAAVLNTHVWEYQEDLLRDIYASLLGVGTIRTRAPYRPSGWAIAESAINPVPRVLHGPAGSANQPWTLAQALQRRGLAAANLVATLPSFGYRANLMVPWSRMNTAERLKTLRGLADEFDVFHFHARSFFLTTGTLRFPSFVDLLLLRLLGKVVVFHFHGTEARLASEFERLNPFNYVAEDPYGFSKSYPEHLQRQMIDFITAVCHATYVPDHELAGYVPRSEVVPRVIDLSEWPALGPSGSPRPLVVHAPTRSEIKGTSFVIEAVEQLKREGLQFDFDLIEGLSHSEAKERYSRADIIVDQLRIGWYGVLAVEGMALGKAVVSYVRPDLLEHLGTPLPLATADPRTVTDVLRRLITGAEERSELGKTGRTFVERVHGADAVAEALEARYRLLLDDAPDRPFDFDGVAALLETQIAHVDRAGDAMVRARKALRRAEADLAQAVPEVKRSLRPLVESLPATPDTPALQEMDRAHRQVHAALEALDSVLPATTSPRPASAPVADAIPGKQLPAARELAVLQQPPSVPPAAPAPPRPGRPAAPPLTVPPSVREVAEANRWGLAFLLDELTPEDRVSWEAVGAATVREPAAGLALLDQLLRQPPDAERDAVARHVTTGTAAALQPCGDGLIVSSPTDEGKLPSSFNVKHQVGFARRFRAFRSVLGRDAQWASGALLGAVLHDLDPECPSPFARAGDDGTRLNDLNWFFAATAGLRASLSAADQERYELALGWFANNTHLWSVEAWRTTRMTLSATLPIRWSLSAGHQVDLPRLVVQRVGAKAPLTLVRPPNPTMDTVETRLVTSIDRVTAPLQLRVFSPRPVELVVALPRYGFNPFSRHPVLDGWEPGPRVAVRGDGLEVLVQIPASAFSACTHVTPFTVVKGRYTSSKLDRQIEQMHDLGEIHPGRGFGARAQQWSDFRDRWAARSAS